MVNVLSLISFIDMVLSSIFLCMASISLASSIMLFLSASLITTTFSLGAYHMPQVIVPVVVGVPASNVPVPFHLIREAKQQVIKLRGTTKPEALDAIEKVLDSL